MNNALVALPVLIPLLGNGVTAALGPRVLNGQRAVSVCALVAVQIVEAVLLVQVYQDGPQVLHVGGWAAPLGIVLVADRLSTLMLLVSTSIALAVLVYAIGQGVADAVSRTPQAVFIPSFLVLTAGVSNAFLAGDLFNLYVGFELLLVASYVLLTLGGTESRLRTGTTYIAVNLLSSVLFLTAIGLVYAATGTLNLAQLAGRLDALGDGIRLVLQLMLLIAFGIKAAVFPLNAWLPDSYSTAPAPVTAVFAGLLTKVGVYAMIRTNTLLFPDGRLDDVLMWVALASMLLPIMGAMVQLDVKRMLSLTLVSHIGFMVFGLALGSARGFSGAVFYIAHHIVVQTSLFLTTGLMDRRGGSTSIDRLGGLARLSPLLAALYFIPALSLGGIPPLSGFIGKVGLLNAGVHMGTPTTYILVAGMMLASLLTLYSVARVWSKAFWREPDTPLPTGPQAESWEGVSGEGVVTTAPFPKAMVGATAALVVLGLAMTVWAEPLVGYAEHTAAELLDRAVYVRAVLGGGA